MHKISKDIKKWTIDKSKLSKSDLEVIEITNFPQQLGYRDCAQKRTKRMQANGGFVDKQITDINDVKYVITSKNVAEYDIARHTATSAEGAQFLKGILKAKANKFEYIDANFIEVELNWLLNRYSEPKPTPSMAAPTPVAKPKKASKKKELTAAQKAEAKELFMSGDMDLKELSKHLKVTQTILKPYLKSLSNG